MTEQSYYHPRHGVRSVKQGFCWPAFFFGSTWALVKRMWYPALPVLFAADVALWLLAGMIAARQVRADWAYALVVQVLYAWICGNWGNDWLRASLRRRGFTPLADLGSIVSAPGRPLDSLSRP